MIDVLIPTYNRAGALAVTLTALAMQEDRDWRLTIADQSDAPVAEDGLVSAAVRLLALHGIEARIERNLPRRGMAQQRQFLLDQVEAELALYLDDDLVLEPWVIGQLREAIEQADCGFVGSPCIGLSYAQDVRPEQQAIEWWTGPVLPETIVREGPGWERYKLHNAANPLHLQQRLGLKPEASRLYKVAWIGGCALYDVAELREVGGFGFWEECPPEHAGEDVFAQLRVMARYGAAGVLPSGVYHQELPTTVVDRSFDAPRDMIVHR